MQYITWHGMHEKAVQLLSGEREGMMEGGGRKGVRDIEMLFIVYTLFCYMLFSFLIVSID